MKGGNLAIFVPHSGCPNQCSFCDQRVISGKIKPPTPSEVRRLCEETLLQLGERASQYEIAFFGGSFTAIDRDYMLSLLEATKGLVGKDGFGGIRVSTRPDAISNEILAILQSYGVTAIELGAQSMNDRVLSLNHRGHNERTVVESSQMIRAHGFSLGLQMMTGLYGSNAELDRETAQKLIALKPDAVRIYPTITLPHTDLAEYYHQGLYHPCSLEETVELVSELMEWFWDAEILLLKVGLHPSEELERSMVAGPYHPAFRELCESRILFRRVQALLTQQGITDGTVLISVLPSEISKMVGQKKQNLCLFKELGITAKVTGNPDHLPMTPRVYKV